MKFTAILFSLLFPVFAFAQTNNFDRVKIATNLQISAGTPVSGKAWVATDSLGNGVWSTTIAGTAIPAGKVLVSTTDNLSVLSATTSSQLLNLLTNPTGTGLAVFNNTPSFTTPILGAATATSINGLTITTSSGTLTIANGKTEVFSNSFTFSGTDGSTIALGSGGTVVYAGANSSITSLSGLSTPLSVAQGGTGAATLGSNLILLGNGTGAVSSIANGTTNQILTANGGSLAPTFKTIASGDVSSTTSNSYSAGTVQTMPRAIFGTSTAVQGQPVGGVIAAYATGLSGTTNCGTFFTGAAGSTSPGYYFGSTNYNSGGGWLINEYSAGRGSIQFLGGFGVLRDNNGLIQLFLTASGGNLWDNSTSVGVIGDTTMSANANTLKLYNSVEVSATNKTFVVKSTSTTIGPGGTSFKDLKFGSGSLTFTGTGAGLTEVQTFTVSGALPGKCVIPGYPSNAPTDSGFDMVVTATNTVSVFRLAGSGGAAAFGPATFNGGVIQ